MGLAIHARQSPFVHFGEHKQKRPDGFANDANYFHKNKHCKLLDIVELKAFFGLLYLWASLKSNLSLADIIWYHESSNDLFAATMSMKCFQFNSRFIEFDVGETRKEL